MEVIISKQIRGIPTRSEKTWGLPLFITKTMGSWGKASLESDEGLDVLDALSECAMDRKSVKLKDLITHYRELGLLSEDPEEEDFLYDNTAIALAEIVCAYIENGKTQYEELSGLKEIVWETEDLLELKQLVQQVLDNKG